MHLDSQGIKLPHIFDVSNLVQKEESTPLEIMAKQFEKIQEEWMTMKLEQGSTF